MAWPRSQAFSAKTGGETLVRFARNAVDFQRLALAVPIRLQNEITQEW